MHSHPLHRLQVFEYERFPAAVIGRRDVDRHNLWQPSLLLPAQTNGAKMKTLATLWLPTAQLLSPLFLLLR